MEPSGSSRGRLWIWIGMAAHVVGAAGTYVVSKPAAVGFTDPAALSLARALLAAVLMLALTGWAIPRPRFSPREWLEVAGLGVLLVAANQWTFLIGMRHTAPGHPALLYSMTPMGVLLLTAALRRGRTPTRHWLGVGLAFAGVALLLRPWDDSRVAHELRLGDLWISAAVVAWVVYTVIARPICRRHHPSTVTTWSLVLGGVAMIPWAGPRLLREPFADFGADVWIGLLWLAAITSVAMMLLWNVLLQRLEPVELAICANAQPPVTALASLLAASFGLAVGEIDLGPLFWAGMACILVGVGLIQARSRASRAAPFPPARLPVMEKLELPEDPEAALAQLREASKTRTVVVFKKSPICPVSSHAEGQFDQWRAAHEGTAGLAFATIDVIAQRGLARGLVAALNVQHESPQALVFKDGELSWHDSHSELRSERFEEVATPRSA